MASGRQAEVVGTETITKVTLGSHRIGQQAHPKIGQRARQRVGTVISGPPRQIVRAGQVISGPPRQTVRVGQGARTRLGLHLRMHLGQSPASLGQEIGKRMRTQRRIFERRMLSLRAGCNSLQGRQIQDPHQSRRVGGRQAPAVNMGTMA